MKRHLTKYGHVKRMLGCLGSVEKCQGICDISFNTFIFKMTQYCIKNDPKMPQYMVSQRSCIITGLKTEHMLLSNTNFLLKNSSNQVLS